MDEQGSESHSFSLFSLDTVCPRPSLVTGAGQIDMYKTPLVFKDLVAKTIFPKELCLDYLNQNACVKK